MEKKKYTEKRREYWDYIAAQNTRGLVRGKGYHGRLQQVYNFCVPHGMKILELGCGCGDLLSSLRPSKGVGVDFSEKMLDQAKERHPELELRQADAHEFFVDEKYDIIIMSDLVNDIEDVQRLMMNIKKCCHPGTRIIINYYSHLWEGLLKLASRIGLKTPTMEQSWLTTEDLRNLFYLSGFDVIRSWQEVLLPSRIPLLSDLANKYLVRLWPFNYLALTNFMIARPEPEPERLGSEPSVSVIVPARNEAGNIRGLMERIPDMGSGTELIFIEGHSQDGTFQEIQKAKQDYQHRRISEYQQTGKGKADAVRLGFSKASGDILMICDADMTVAPEDLTKFYDCIKSGKAEFVNGVRLVYPMESKAMRFLNLLGNRFFGMCFTWLIGQPIKDSLCGTKVLSRKNYELVREGRSYFGDFDPFGDFDLLFGAAKLNLKIVDLPIRYKDRLYGSTQISRWSHGLLLLKMTLFALRHIKFV